MATDREWSDAYLAQAKEDLTGAIAVQGRSTAVFAMLLQMSFEKFAKAQALRRGSYARSYLASHHGICEDFATALYNQHLFIDGLGNKRVWDDAKYVILALEKAHPALAKAGPHLEYPWEDTNGKVLTPIKNLAIVQTLADGTNRYAANTIAFGKALSENFHTIFR